jgi:hypothetical protein
VNIKKNLFLIFVLMGALCGVAGIVLTGYVAAGTIGAGTNYELDAIASCILGGTSPLGGSGHNRRGNPRVTHHREPRQRHERHDRGSVLAVHRPWQRPHTCRLYLDVATRKGRR